MVEQLREMSTVEYPPQDIPTVALPPDWAPINYNTDLPELTPSQHAIMRESWMDERSNGSPINYDTELTPSQQEIMRESWMDERSNDASFKTARENSIALPTKELNEYIDLVKTYP